MNKKLTFRLDGALLTELESYKKAGDNLTDALKRVIKYGGRYRDARDDEILKIHESMDYWNILPDEIINLDAERKKARIGVYQDIFTRIYTRKINKKDLKIYLQDQIKRDNETEKPQDITGIKRDISDYQMGELEKK